MVASDFSLLASCFLVRCFLVFLRCRLGLAYFGTAVCIQIDGGGFMLNAIKEVHQPAFLHTRMGYGEAA